MPSTAIKTGSSTTLSNRTNSKPETDVRDRGGIARYTGFWNKDSAKDTDTQNQNRLDDYQTVTNAYYDGATDLYEYGWGKVGCLST